MNGWVIAGICLALLFLLGQVRVGIGVEYTCDGLSVRARLGPLRLKVFPRPPRAKKEKKPKKEQKPQKVKKTAPPPEEKSVKEKVGGALELVQAFLPLALEAAGCFWKRLVVDELELCLTVGSADPADAAMLYGQANAALGALWQPLTQAFHVKNGRGHVQVDFQAEQSTLYGKAALSLKIGQIARLGVHFGVKALVRLIQYRSAQKARRQERKAV